MMEEWRAVPGYEGLYEVSNTGNVKSLIKNNIIKSFINKKGYRLVSLSKNGIIKKFSVHRLAAQAFIPNPDNLPMVNHKDEDKTNNSVDNLEWCDAKYNNNYGTANIRRSETLIKNRYCTGLSKEESKKKYYQENKEKIREQHREYMKVYREKNKEKIREQNREYYEKNKEKKREQFREYYKEIREQRREYMREYYEENKEKIREYMREYRKKRKEK